MLKTSRKNLGLSQEELAKKIGVKQCHVSKIENAKFNNVTIELIKKISDELRLNPVDVFLFFYNNSSF